MASPSAINTDQYFKTGAIVEISSNEEGFRGSLYLGTVIRLPGNAKRRTGKVLVEYKTIMEDDGARRGLREEVDLVDLRPPPPTEFRASFNLSDDVDAYYNEGWWEGVITAVKGNGKYSVFFRGTREQIDFKASQLRLHREWVHGKWVPPVEQVQSASPSKKPPSSSGVKSKKRKVEHEFSPGASVEVKSNEEGFQGAWFAATILEKLEEGKYMVEYPNFKNEEGDSKLTEKVNSQYIRPCPPDVESVDSFTALQKVDALYNDAWWVGEIEKVLEDNKYCVYFKITGEKLIFKHSDLRGHYEWIDGKWVVDSKIPQRKQDAGDSLISGKRCTHCQAKETPQWRAGPLGPSTLCNACGVRFKKGRLIPECRPDCNPVPIEASPTANSATIPEATEISGTSSPEKPKPLCMVNEATPTSNSAAITEATEISGTSTPEKFKLLSMIPQESQGGLISGKRCAHCQVQETPQWRAGPLGPSTLCNACGVRFKKGRLFPEYRPASSPTFSPEVHSNSHQKVLKMRMQRSG